MVWISLFACLDAQFMREDYDRVDEVVSAFWNLRRDPGQTIEAYLAAMTAARLQMKKDNPDTKISDQAYAVRLLKRANLSPTEKQNVLSATGARYETLLVEGALRRLCRDSHKHDRTFRHNNFRVKPQQSRGRNFGRRPNDSRRGGANSSSSSSSWQKGYKKAFLAELTESGDGSQEEAFNVYD